MAKTVTVCPFSKGRCIECAIYRGRHVEVCRSATYRGDALFKMGQSRLKPVNGSTNVKFETPDIPDCSKRLKDIEDSGC